MRNFFLTIFLTSRNFFLTRRRSCSGNYLTTWAFLGNPDSVLIFLARSDGFAGKISRSHGNNNSWRQNSSLTRCFDVISDSISGDSRIGCYRSTHSCWKTCRSRRPRFHSILLKCVTYITYERFAEQGRLLEAWRHIYSRYSLQLVIINQVFHLLFLIGYKPESQDIRLFIYFL